VFSWVDTGIKGEPIVLGAVGFLRFRIGSGRKEDIGERDSKIQPWHRRAKSKVGSPREPHPEALV
jgi:hypothetical protein